MVLSRGANLKKVIIGVTGGIAAYKVPELARLFVRSGIDVQVVMTPAAAEFITPLTFQTLTGNPVFVEMYGDRTGERVRHVELLENADLMVIAPATANTLGKMALGLADNLLATLYLAADCPVVVIPSMNVNMFKHPAVVSNIELLQKRGCHVMDPDQGELACGVYGSGRMPEPYDIFNFARRAVMIKDYQGIEVLVTAGPTREPLDPVRYISNPSTGLMGFSLARALSDRGALVTLVSGPTHLTAPAGVRLVKVNTAAEMREAVLSDYSKCRIIYKAAAVSDFRPAENWDEKVKKEKASMTLQLASNPDILLELGKNKGNKILVGFAAETEDALQNAHDKLVNKNLDLIIVNNLKEPGSGFAVNTNRVSIIDRDGKVEEIPLMEKEELAHLILDRTAVLLKK